jgi:putative nucleotidyltransferase with HDIG domain
MSRKRPSPAHVRVVGRPAQSRLNRLACWIQDAWRRTLELRFLWILVYLLVGTWALMPRFEAVGRPVVAGDIAAREYIATQDLMVPDQATTAERRRQAREAVLAVYDRDVALRASVDRGLETLFRTGREWVKLGLPDPELEGSRSTDLAPHLEELTELRITPEQFELLAGLGFSEDLEETLRSLANELLRRGIVDNRALLIENRAKGVTLRNLETGREQIVVNLFDYREYPEEVRDIATTRIRAMSGLTTRQRTGLAQFVVDNVTPNVFPNRTETLARQDRAESATAPVFQSVRQGQVIVRKGDRISPSQAQAIDTLRGDRSVRAQILPLLGSVLLLTLGAGVLWAGLRHESYPHKSAKQLLSECLILVTFMLVMGRLGLWISQGLGDYAFSLPGTGAESYIYAIPLASLGLVVALLYGRSMALLLAVVYAVLTAQIAGRGSFTLAIYCLAGSLTAIYALQRFPVRHRFAMARVGMVIGLVNVMAILVVTALARTDRATPELLGFDTLFGLLGGLLAAATASFLVPIFEALFSITTDLRLVELSNTNLPLLRRLAFEAPGSFQHSLMVANLAKAGCSEIGADSTLAYAAGLYHDVGKIYRPEYFIENQHSSHNPHDNLSPSMSVLVLVNHIKDGLDLATQYRLPRPMRDAIAQHHGSRLINFFYRRALEQQAKDAPPLVEEEYRYPGPRPQSRVMGVLMLADGVEAASRTLVDPTPLTIRSVIEKIFEDCIKDGQLDETDLTLADLNRISDAFFHVLSNIFHRRVDYPGFDFGDKRGRRGSTEELIGAHRPS